MNDSENNLEQWESCEGGQLRQAVRQIQIHRRRQSLTRFGGFAVLLMIVVLIGGLALDRHLGLSKPLHGGITCADVKANLSEFIAERNDSDLHHRIAVHLDECPSCKRHYQRLSTELKTTKTLSHAPNCACDQCSAKRRFVLISMVRP